MYILSPTTHQQLPKEECGSTWPCGSKFSDRQITEIKQRRARLVLDGWPVFESHCQPYVEVLGWVPGGTNNIKLWMSTAAENALNSPQRRWDCTRESFNTKGCKFCSLLNSMGYQTINIHIYIFHLRIPKSIETRLSNISSNKAIFIEAKPAYEKALQEAGHRTTLNYLPKRTNTQNAATPWWHDMSTTRTRHTLDWLTTHKYRNATALSNYIWMFKDKKISYSLKWKIMDRGRTYKPSAKNCSLCELEKFYIITKPELASLN